jgi:hypothetical protein
VTTESMVADLVDERPVEDSEGTDRLFDRLNAAISHTWTVARRSDAWRYIEVAGFDRDLYRDLMVQVYHYTRFNSLNQAMTVARVTPEERALLRFVYHHADEELGHEQMVVHDLRSAGMIGPDDDLTSFPKAAATDALINYLTGLAVMEGPVARLGYSYWAESVYAEIAPLLAAARTSLALTDRQMTFFIAHSSIDEHHAAEVRRVIEKVATTPAQQEAIYRVATTTLWLTTQLIEQTFAAWMTRRSEDG